MKYKVLLNGDKMPENEFLKRFKEIVGCTQKEWFDKETTEYEGTGETYEWKDDKFVIGGSAYNNPCLFELTT